MIIFNKCIQNLNSSNKKFEYKDKYIPLFLPRNITKYFDWTKKQKRYRNNLYKSLYSYRIINLHNCRITELICKYIQMIFTNYGSDKIISCYVDQHYLSKFEMKKLSHRPFLKLWPQLSLFAHEKKGFVIILAMNF